MLFGSVLTLIFLSGFCGQSQTFKSSLDSTQLTFLSNALPADYSSVAPHELSLIEPLLIPRPPGSLGNQKVFNFIVSHFQKLDWNVEVDSFSSTTPIGLVNFSNIMVSSNPSARRKLVLAAHYDSKIIKGIEFIGATDSAVPCGILMNVAQRLNPYLLQAINQDTSLDMIFFDGEEAFVEWTGNDSIYGSKHLAEKWSKEMIQHQGSKNGMDGHQSSFESILSTIDLFVLLDLLGTSDSSIPNYFPKVPISNEAYLRLVDIQDRLAKINLLSKALLGRIPKDGGLFATARQTGSLVEDDHIPFLQRNVPVLHVIPSPFPLGIWHEAADNKDAIDQEIVKDWCLLWAAFVAEYLGIGFNTNPV